MPTLTEKQIKNIYKLCNSSSIALDQLLAFCLDPYSGITIEGLRQAGYKKIDLLEAKYMAEAEEKIWAASQGSEENLAKYIEMINNGKFSTAHLDEAKELLNKLAWERSQKSIDGLADYIKKIEQGAYPRAHYSEAKTLLGELAKDLEDKEWEYAKSSGDLSKIMSFISKCEQGIYSTAHLAEAKGAAEITHWKLCQSQKNEAMVRGFLKNCEEGKYSNAYFNEARVLLDKIANGALIDDWEKVQALKPTYEDWESGNGEKKEADYRTALVNFGVKYARTPTDTAQKYVGMASEERQKLDIDIEARKAWLEIKDSDSLLDFAGFIELYPFSRYREAADAKIESLKSDLLTDMKRFPFKYNREEMYRYISTNALTMRELVDESHVLTDRAYSHIKEYPTLKHEQRDLKLSENQTPQSEAGNTDIFFFGVPGSGKTCLLSGLMSLDGRLGFTFDPRGPGGAGGYAQELQNYARKSKLPAPTDKGVVQVIDAKIKDEEGSLRKISLIEMSGEKTAKFAAMENATSLQDLGPGAAGLFSNDNNKVLFFVIDPTNDKDIEMGDGSKIYLTQDQMLRCVTSLLNNFPAIMRKVVAIHIVMTKSDTLGDFVDQDTISKLLNDQGYTAVLQSIKDLCEDYGINRQTGFKVGLYPFCVGKFLPGEVYTFDETDSLKILRVIQKNTVATRLKGRSFGDKFRDFFNS